MDKMLDTILLPLARFLVARGALFPTFSEGMKRAYLRAATEAVPGKPTDSAISVATGLQRRDVARLKGLPAIPRTPPDPLSRLVAQWLSDPRYGEGAVPRVVPRKGEAPSFDALASDIRKDVHPRTMFEQLLAAGTIAHEVETDMVRLVARAYVPLAGSEAQLRYLVDNIGDHLSAAVENVTRDVPLHFERAVHYDSLTAEDVAALKALYEERQMHLLEDLNRQAAARQAAAPSGATHRFRAGGYFYQRDEAGE